MEGDARDCSCEELSTSEHGVVTPDERLARVVVSPNHLNSKGVVKPGVLPPTHIELRGLSLLRRDKIDEVEMNKQAAAIAATLDGAVHGVIVVKAEAARSIQDASGDQALCVVDDPVKNDKSLPDNPAHAVIVGTGRNDDAERLRIREVLLKKFGPLTTVVDEYQ